MHEMALTRRVVEIACAQARAAAADRIVLIRLELGALSHLAPEAVAFCFESVALGTVAEGATLDIVRVPAQGACGDCGQMVTVTSRLDPCPHCGSHRLTLSSGEEMRVLEMEVT